jgi:hypothetical protein
MAGVEGLGRARHGRLIPDPRCSGNPPRRQLDDARAQVRSVVTQNVPTPALPARLAGAVDLVADGTMLMRQPGERVALGCSGLIYHAAPDASSLELADPEELAGQWINVIQAIIDRDWTWRGTGSPTLVISRTVTLPDAVGAPSDTVDAGVIELMNTINTQAVNKPDRSFIRLMFLDALPPRMGPDGLPYEIAVTYKLRLRLEGGSSVNQSIETRLPIVTPPAQVPRVVAVGIALTPYDHDPEYASTSSRTRRLWLEFAEP